MSETYLTGKDYNCCGSCKKAIDEAYGLILLGVADDYLDDPEGPSMLAYDKRWLCDEDCE